MRNLDENELKKVTGGVLRLGLMHVLIRAVYNHVTKE